MSENNPGRGNINGNGSSFKRPRLLSFQGPSSESVALNHGGRPPMAAGPSSSSLEEINVRQPALVDMRPGMAADLASWQEAQITACIEDNTINMVLEQYLNFFETRHYGVDVPGVVPDPVDEAEMEQEPEVELLEDRAIMAAISERGLQPAQSSDIEDALEEQGDGTSMAAAGVERRVNSDHQQGMDLLETAVVVAIQEKGLVTSAGGNQLGHMDEEDGS
ncbi:uncharacterized protein LOC134226472 [Armigeres subalbatus]|uniref:uncharacterized protein LOC134226472 n=1 Tax=Armigeres subalbatus TaxID=124917 RepID=UPI002ED5E101